MHTYIYIYMCRNASLMYIHVYNTVDHLVKVITMQSRNNSAVCLYKYV